jgi:hypothetical protein
VPTCAFDEIVRDRNGKVIAHPVALAMDAMPIGRRGVTTMPTRTPTTTAQLFSATNRLIGRASRVLARAPGRYHAFDALSELPGEVDHRGEDQDPISAEDCMRVIKKMLGALPPEECEQLLQYWTTWSTTAATTTRT